MNQILQSIIIATALTTTGCLCGFFMVLNWIKQEERRVEKQQDEQTKKQII